MDENATRQRKQNDQEVQKWDTTIDLETTIYGTAEYSYPDGTVLLDTLVLYGKISYEVENVKIWERGWMPSERAVLDLEREWKSVPVANVQFVVNTVGGVNCNVLEVQSPDKGLFSWVKCMKVNSKRIIAAFSWVKCMKVNSKRIIAACLVGVIIFGIWRMSTWGQSGGAPDIKSKLSDPSRV